MEIGKKIYQELYRGCTAIVLVSVVFVVFLNAINKMNVRGMNTSHTSTKQTKIKKAQPNEKMSLEIKTYKKTFHHISSHFVSGGFEKVARAVQASSE